MGYEVLGFKEGYPSIKEQTYSQTKAEWIAAYYIEHGYHTQIHEIAPLTSGSL